jgi:hypothetical protein
MSARGLLADLRARGVVVTVDGDHLHLDGPDTVLTDGVIEAVAAHKSDLLTLLRDMVAAPSVPCGLCSTIAWFWEPDWPVAGEDRWLCGTCSSRPSPSLADVYAGLTADRRARFMAEVKSGDELARSILGLLNPAPEDSERTNAGRLA